MKFRFCGDLDCPDWVLAEVATLSKLSSVRMKILTAQILLHCANGTFNYEKVLKLAADESDGVSDLKGAVAAVHFIVANAAKHDVDETSLVQEIQQLGLPKENSEAVGKLYREKKDEMRDRFAADSYTISRLLRTEWRIDRVMASSAPSSSTANGGAAGTGTTTGDNVTVAHLKLTCDTRTQDGPLTAEQQQQLQFRGGVDGYRVRELAFEISQEKLDVLVHELTRAQAVLDSLEA